MDLVSGSYRIGRIYHFECPKDIKMFRREENKKLCEETLRKVAERHNIS
ncbi:MAG: hypothetical protein QMC85_06035 [Methanocellales archaeon]|nr:hypothetical protein [Methanocellales archaeon]